MIHTAKTSSTHKVRWSRLIFPAALLASGAFLAHNWISPSPKNQNIRDPKKSMNLLTYVGTRQAQPDLHDGGLSHMPGVKTVCVLRADRDNLSLQNGNGWTYQHAPMLAHWNNQFWLSFLSSPRDEHAAPCRTLLTSSPNGFDWSPPRELFPAYPNDTTRVIMHQRCGFYLAPNGVFLAVGFYGVVSGDDGPPFGAHGIGRVARRIHEDGAFGPVYYVKHREHRCHDIAPQLPFYTQADDAMRAACDALLHDRIKTLEWWDEQRNEPDFFAHAAVAAEMSAVSLYRNQDYLIGIGKWGRVVFSQDDGASWRDGGTLENLPTNGAKVWAQKLSNGKFVLVCNPTSHNNHRWPLAVVTSDDGLQFDDLRCIVGEVPPMRYAGRFKDLGPQYVRGLEVGDAPDGALWLAYSMNKEDIYVARVPVKKALM
jgi:hypothetical protein